MLCSDICKVVYIVGVSKILHKIAILGAKFTETAFRFVPNKPKSVDISKDFTLLFPNAWSSV